MKIPLTRLHKNAIIPTRSNPASAIFRLHACIEAPVAVRRGAPAIVIPTGWAFALPGDNVSAMLYPMRQLAHRSGLVFGRGVDLLDKTELTEVLISVWNLGQYDEVLIRPGDPIAQMVFMPIIAAEFEVPEDSHD